MRFKIFSHLETSPDGRDNSKNIFIRKKLGGEYKIPETRIASFDITSKISE